MALRRGAESMRAGIFRGRPTVGADFKVRKLREPVILKDNGHSVVFTHADRVLSGSAAHQVIGIGIENGGNRRWKSLTVSGR